MTEARTDRRAGLQNGERELFELVNQAAFINPFSERRLELDARIAQASPGAAPASTLDEALARLRAALDTMERNGRADVRLFTGWDRGLLQHAILFDLFHRFIEAFDRLIGLQNEAGEESLPVPFAGDLLAGLARRGFTPAEGERFLAIFYQLRRAFYFINRQLPGGSPCMRGLRVRLWNNIFTHDIRGYVDTLWEHMEDFSLLLLGETGTGKGTAAAAIGRSGFIPFEARRGRFAESFTRSFVAINLSQFPETLIESELFGHCKGAFTGAVEAHEGIFARCSPHGAIFLDEIGDAPQSVQLKLLKVLQERTFCPVGSHEVRRFRGRVIAATNGDLDALRRAGTFREDFYYRLCSDVVVVPPLRQRLAEEPRELEELLAAIFPRVAGGDDAGLRDQVLGILRREPGSGYRWPGNVRELEQGIRRILVTGGGPVAAAPAPAAEWFAEALRETPVSAQDLLGAYCAMLHRRHGSYEAVARLTGLDRRTVRKHVAHEPGTAAAAG